MKEQAIATGSSLASFWVVYHYLWLSHSQLGQDDQDCLTNAAWQACSHVWPRGSPAPPAPVVWGVVHEGCGINGHQTSRRINVQELQVVNRQGGLGSHLLCRIASRPCQPGPRLSYMPSFHSLSSNRSSARYRLRKRGLSWWPFFGPTSPGFRRSHCFWLGHCESSMLCWSTGISAGGCQTGKGWCSGPTLLSC